MNDNSLNDKNDSSDVFGEWKKNTFSKFLRYRNYHWIKWRFFDFFYRTSAFIWYFFVQALIFVFILLFSAIPWFFYDKIIFGIFDWEKGSNKINSFLDFCLIIPPSIVILSFIFYSFNFSLVFFIFLFDKIYKKLSFAFMDNNDKKKLKMIEEEEKEDILNNLINKVRGGDYFKQAFTHVSYLNESEGKSKNICSYETLEFLGDSILNFHVALFIFNKFKNDPTYSEGKMSKLKQLMIREETLAYLSKKFKLSNYLILGSGEKRNNGLDNDSILADIFESFIAALYLELGEKDVFEFLNVTIFPWIEGKENVIWDYKSKLQEYCQSKKIKFSYTSSDYVENNSLKKTFISKLVLNFDNGNILEEEGKGKNKRESEQSAAKKMLERIKEFDNINTNNDGEALSFFDF